MKRSIKPAPAKKTAAKMKLSSPQSFDLRRFCHSFAVGPEEVSRMTGAALRTVAYWKSGKEPNGLTQQKLKELVHLFDALSDVISSKSIGPWLSLPNPAFDGSTPLQVIERGESHRIWRMIWELGSGEPD